MLRSLNGYIDHVCKDYYGENQSWELIKHFANSINQLLVNVWKLKFNHTNRMHDHQTHTSQFLEKCT